MRRPCTWTVRDTFSGCQCSHRAHFHKLPNGTFGLRNWYDEATINASKRDKEVETDEEPEAEVIIAEDSSDGKISA